ncbi:lasso peptide biosynthesis B2 protein [Thermomonas sp. HDW16]|uniref:lasso peptide biosynthesis B2 protein n=1 Tax=Thermomonas sp. HDW16 TaxID=2714945 RepID=UPI0014093D95|nr:lasso peptide biosynthesis B2 protein [Thermomonas sp. HDW16]QIL20532.1 lasso peptide biosynthesis B2 protein [Thermomonas sp. HDW16]
MGARLQGWLRLPAPERRQFLLVLCSLPMMSSLLSMRGYSGTLRLIEHTSRHACIRNATADDVQSAERLAQLTTLAGAHGPLSTNCLPQALLVYWQLRRKGLAPELRLGGRREQGRFDAHAWVELDGKALGQTALVHAPFLKRDRA